MEFNFRFLTLLVLLSGALMLTACGNSASDGPAMSDIPTYPNAEIGETMEQHFPGGMMGGSLQQYSTTDSYEDVLDFYTDALIEYETELMEHPSELGRQAAISILKENGVITVAIQEFTAEGSVNITFMEVGG
jgi:hypothetical protein